MSKLENDVVSDIPIYGFPVTATNFTVELLGLCAFSINYVHDAADISIGMGVAFDCCDKNATNVSKNSLLNVNNSTVLNIVTIPVTVSSTKITNSTVSNTETVSETIKDIKVTN
ncbi:hypothetical protein C6P45_003357 [Maudiozyma exigua]|uniref:Uncharacterized protein n=1 Tax=Maudiozyma exigua TaxID=34358 RepID=A0A9P6VUS7_MAUEX|nr:hypothetical protein C6P45_003357 [Kazachstania exigua]